MATSLLPGQRRTRFARLSPPPLRLTDDDIAIVRHVARHRFLRSTHIVRLMPERSVKKVIERLGALFHAGYLDRPRSQLEYYATAGSAPLVYALGNRGALLLAERDGLDRAQVDWTWKNRSVGRLYIEHTLLTADVIVAAELVQRQHATVRMIGTDAILANAPEATRRAANPFKLAVRATHAGTVRDLSVVPDAVFGFDLTATRVRKYFFLEADRATMPITRADLAQTSILRKLVTYLAGGGTGNSFGRHFGIGNFRVLMVTTSAERIASMIDTLKELTGGNGSAQFLFADRASFAEAPDLLMVPWTTGKGDRVTLAN